MIRLYIQEYCDQCCDFEPDVTKPDKIYGFDLDEPIVLSDTIIRCKYAKRCENIRRYLKQRNATYNGKD